MLQVHMLCSGLPMTNLTVEFLDGMFSLEGQEGGWFVFTMQAMPTF